MSSPITFQINDRPFNLEAPRTIIEAADQLGIYIPRFCYHKKLSVVANCRMCLVEVEGLPKPVPACATAITPDMHILTKSAKTKAAQQAVMEFLLINHPLDCPICDQGGQCELQDLAMRYGSDESDFDEKKRSVPNDDLGPLLATEMTRCIQCTRCVRFGSEVAGNMELGATGRGEHMQITTYVKKSLTSELSGNMIDVCPVGALTSKPFRFKARAWELRSFASIAPHDCLGSNISVHTHDQQVMRVLPRENEAINEVWLSDRDRYSYLGLAHPERLTHPMIKGENGWERTDWSTALDYAAHLLKTTLEQQGAQLGGLISPSATLEEMYLFQKLCRGLGSSNIDHRLHEIDTRDQLYLPQVPVSEVAISDLDQCDLVVLVGANIQREQPLLITRLRKVINQGGCVVSLNCVDYDFSFDVTHKVIVQPDQLSHTIHTLTQRCDTHASTESSSDHTEASLLAIASALKTAKRAVIVTGAITQNHPEAAYLRHQVTQLAAATHAKVMHLTEGANSTGGWIAGAIPHRIEGGKPLNQADIGMAAHEMIQKKLAAYLLFNIEPDLDCANPNAAQSAIEAAKCVIAFTSFASSSLLESAHILLPIHCFSENSGTFVNIEGKWQSFDAILPHQEASRLGWEALHLLAKVLKVAEDIDLPLIRERLQHALEDTKKESEYIRPQAISLASPDASDKKTASLKRITEWPLYSIDPLVRRAIALQQAGSSEKTGAYIHPDCAKRLMLKQGQLIRLRQNNGISEPLPVIIDSAVLDGCVWTPAGRFETRHLGASFGDIEVLVDDKQHA